MLRHSLRSPILGRHVSIISSTWTRASSTMSSRPKLLLLGDSLTEEGTNPSLGGWVCQLQHRYTRSADVVVRGLYGYNTEAFVQHALPSIKRDLIAWTEPPSLVTLWLGGNDSALLSGCEAVLHVPIEKYRANLCSIVKAVQEEAPEASVLMITPPAVNDQARLKLSADKKLDFSTAGTAEYARACIEEAKQLGLPVLDLHGAMYELADEERLAFQYDGLHFNNVGNAFVLEKVLAAIEHQFPALAKRLETWEHPDYLELTTSTQEMENN